MLSQDQFFFISNVRNFIRKTKYIGSVL